ncbi:hypothetical protein SEMRO_2110_G315000.1 [Seminavis robusta]|uniref:Uncharacterized protein n=1 Tax=Seminavis robusta TaxID=568900 RepID=A0A9N8ETN0_9STRA|nr:hypothetical protein SEMRO_2110_G315000.1 [Seminavis robusta]|eukprot:Sro2110_g315000.1 n/a (136) ;mRNA; f:9976-10383
MEWWGRGIDPEWFSAVLGMLDYYITNSAIFEEATRKELFYDCIMLLMEKKLDRIEGLEQGLNRVVELELWQRYYNDYLYGTITTDYFLLATNSIQFMNNRVWHWLHSVPGTNFVYGSVQDGPTPDVVESVNSDED